MNSCLFLDLDGTLVDSRADLTTAVNHMRGSFNLPELPVAKVVSFVGNGIGKLVERSLDGTGCDPQLGRERMLKYYSQHLTDRTTLYPGVRTSLAELSAAGFILVVITNKTQQAAKQILNKFEVLKYLDAVKGGDCGIPLKPAPDALLAALAEFSGDPAKSCMIGDNYTDLAAARAAHVFSVYAKYGFGDPRGEKYDFAVRDFPEFAQNAMLQKLREFHKIESERG